MIDDRLVEQSLCQEHLFPFAWRVFEHLHPGQTFSSAWHVEALCYALEQVAAGKTPRLTVNMPPRYGKSIVTAVAFPAWLLGRNPAQKIMVASYGGKLAADHARLFRQVITADWYQRLFPQTRLADDGNRAEEQITTAGGRRHAVSVGGAATGFGADVLIIDDLMKAADVTSAVERQRVTDFYDQTLYSRLNDKANAPIISIQQRLHEDDLTAHLGASGRFAQLTLRAIAIQDEAIPIGFGRVHRRRKGEALWPEREPLTLLEGIRLDMGAQAFSAQYQQDPTPPGGNRIRWEWFGTYEGPPDRSECVWVAQSWDTGFSAEPTSDFSVGTTWGFQNNQWRLLDIERTRLDFPDLKVRVSALARRWNADLVLIEKAGSGIPLVQQLFREQRSWRPQYIGITPKLEKETRVEAQTARLATGNYLLPMDAPWLESFRRELLAFPNGKNDDQVDSLTQFLEWSASPRGQDFVERDPVTGRPLYVRRPQRVIRR